MESCAHKAGATIPCKIGGFPPFPAIKPKLSRRHCLAIADALLTANNTPNISAEARAWLDAIGCAAAVTGDVDARQPG